MAGPEIRPLQAYYSLVPRTGKL